MMIRSLILAAVVALAGCSPSSPKPQAFDEFTAVPVGTPPPAQKPTHIYRVKDGSMYGYERVVTEEEQKAGHAVAPLMMFGYAGERDGVHQVVQLDDHQFIRALQFSDDKAFIKVMTFVNHKLVKKEILPVVDGMIGQSALIDAENGFMDRLVLTVDGRQGYVWCDEKAGCKGQLLPKKQ